MVVLFGITVRLAPGGGGGGGGGFPPPPDPPLEHDSVIIKLNNNAQVKSVVNFFITSDFEKG
jgi:hypothetical protein